MGRPLDKEFFGPDAIRCIAKVGDDAAADGYIVKQTATREFIVNVDGVELKCKLVDKNAADLEVGEMIVNVLTETGAVSRVTTFKSHVLTTADGKQAVWNTGVASNPAPLQVSTSDDPVIDVPPVETHEPTVTENGSINELFRKPSGVMLNGSSNPVDKMFVATDGQLEVAIGSGYVGRSLNNPESVDGHYTLQLTTGSVENDWSFRFSFGLLENPGKRKLTDLYTIEIVPSVGDTTVEAYTLVEKDNTLVIESPLGDITDSYLSEDQDVIQNIQRLSFINADYKVGEFSFVVTATPKNGDSPLVIEYSVTALAPEDAGV